LQVVHSRAYRNYPGLALVTRMVIATQPKLWCPPTWTPYGDKVWLRVRHYIDGAGTIVSNRRQVLPNGGVAFAPSRRRLPRSPTSGARPEVSVNGIMAPIPDPQEMTDLQGRTARVTILAFGTTIRSSALAGAGARCLASREPAIPAVRVSMSKLSLVGCGKSGRSRTGCNRDTTAATATEPRSLATRPL
jgi:hypothetical protein